jgi:A118 family predicted phage portal protein|nr:MAG TPA: portal protein [Caudoviricetes sp.]
MWLFDKLLNRNQAGIWDEADISLPMARAITGWLNAFYNNPNWATNQVRLSALPSTITGFVATLVTNELSISCGTSTRAKYIEEQLQPLTRKLHNAVQLATAGGQIIIRPFVQDGKFYFDLVQPGRFFPTRFNPDGRVMAGYFVDYRDVKGKEYIRIERFDCDGKQMIVSNKAYRSAGDIMGSEVPLATVPQWAELEPEITINGIKQPLFGCIQMPFANTVDDASPLPVSIYANAMDSIMEFDKVYSEMLYELHSGRRKSIVERQALVPMPKDTNKRGKRFHYFDPTSDVYILDPAEQAKPFQDYSPALRTAEYMTGLKAILHIVENQCHLSPGTMAIDERTGTVTATQVISQDRTTYNTCSAIQQQGVTQGLLDVITAMNAMCELYQLAPAGELVPAVTYGDGVFEDTQQEFSRRIQMVQADILKPEQLLAWYFGVDVETAQTEYLKEQTDTVDLFGGA